MQKENKISIVIPVYNVEQYIGDCLYSVINQTMHDGLECIMVDDCGKDDSIAIAERIVASYKGPIRFKILRHSHNKGLSAARNTGMKEATGMYIYFLDSDDTITPDCMTTLWAKVLEHPGVDCICAGANMTDGGQWLNLSNRHDVPEYTNDIEWIRCNMLMQLLPMTAWNHLIRLSLIKENQMSFIEGIYNEDEPWNWNLAHHISTLAICKRETYNYVIREGSIQNNPAILQRRWDSTRIYIKDWINHIDGIMRNEQLYTIFNRIYNLYLNPIVDGSSEDCYELFNRLSKISKFRQRFAIHVVCLLPKCLLQKIGPLQLCMHDLFGQYKCKKYVDFGMSSYIKRFKFCVL